MTRQEKGPDDKTFPGEQKPSHSEDDSSKPTHWEGKKHSLCHIRDNEKLLKDVQAFNMMGQEFCTDFHTEGQVIHFSSRYSNVLWGTRSLIFKNKPKCLR